MTSIVLGLLADPDLPSDIAHQLADELPQVLAESVSEEVEWDVQVFSQALPLDDDGQLRVWKYSSEIKARHGWDQMVCLTELTRRIDGQLILSNVHIPGDVALVSLPALGPVRLPRHVRNAVVRVVRIMTDDTLQPDREADTSNNQMHLSPNLQAPVRQESDDENEGTNSYLALKGNRGKVRIVLGMVRINEPWLLVPSLSGAMAAALAGAAFGIFYASIWGMADALSPARLASISAIAVVAMVIWLIGYNQLWERPKQADKKKETRLYNAATAITLLIGVTCWYLLLLVIATLGALVIIPAGYLETNLQHPVTWADYLQLASLAAALGAFAGALGSSFESSAAIRQATYGKREYERHQPDDDDHGTNR